MKNAILTGFLAATLLSASALAEKPDLKSMSPKERHEAMKNMTPEQREKFEAERKAQWESMSDAEKLEKIEQRRAQFKAEHEAKWNSMSDAEKIKHAEEMFGKRKHGGPQGD